MLGETDNNSRLLEKGRVEGISMIGADSLVKTLLAGSVDVCFTNPGTSEMHFVAALDRHAGMRSVLCLFEGVATGAADGYARMTERPAATLLHLGPGLGNGLANIHNAKRARSPMINIVGDHADYHLPFDSPLTSDIPAIASPVSHWVQTAPDAGSVAEVAAAAIRAANLPPGQIATLILPANTAWEKADNVVESGPAVDPAPVSSAAIEQAAKALHSGEPCLLFLGDRALRREAQLNASRIAVATGAELLTPVSNARAERGAGCVPIERTPYPIDKAVERLSRFRHVILAGAGEPVGFFAYPGKPSRMLPDTCQRHVLAEPGQDIAQALAALAEQVAAKARPRVLESAPPALPSGELTAAKLAAVVAAQLPDNAIIVDESISSGRDFFSTLRDVPPHDWLQITGGAIGIGPPLAAGAAVACPDRKVIALQADGAAMYTLQALWTQAREGLDITTVVLSNRAYAILQGEMRNVGANPGPTARDLMELDRPPLDWVQISRGLGVEAECVAGADAFNTALARGLATPGPYLIEARIP